MLFGFFGVYVKGVNALTRFYGTIRRDRNNRTEMDGVSAVCCHCDRLQYRTRFCSFLLTPTSSTCSYIGEKKGTKATILRYHHSRISTSAGPTAVWKMAPKSVRYVPGMVLYFDFKCNFFSFIYIYSQE